MIVLFATSALIAYESEQRNNPAPPPQETIPQATIVLPSATPTGPEKSGQKEGSATICGTSGGTWLAAYKECEGIDKETCERHGGIYNSCASACRHKPETEVCIQVCVEVCDLRGAQQGGP